jgi:hypothetical protein
MMQGSPSISPTVKSGTPLTGSLGQPGLPPSAPPPVEVPSAPSSVSRRKEEKAFSSSQSPSATMSSVSSVTPSTTRSVCQACDPITPPASPNPSRRANVCGVPVTAGKTRTPGASGTFTTDPLRFDRKMEAWSEGFTPTVNYNFNPKIANGPFDFGVPELDAYWNEQYERLPVPVYPPSPAWPARTRHSDDFFNESFYIVTRGFKVSCQSYIYIYITVSID